MLAEFVRGEETGTEFPTTIEAFRKTGTAFLTQAFRAVGAIPADDEIVAITRADEFVGGGMGRKLLLDVEYARGEGLGEQLFVKFPLDEGHPQRELFTWPMRAEVRFYLMSMETELPVAIPRAYFADFNSDAPSGILITERIAYGSGTVEDPLEKCQDFKLGDQFERYRIVTEANAALAGTHKAGGLGPTVNAKFPFPGPRQAGGERFPYSQDEVNARVDKLRSYAARAPHLLPKDFSTPAFLDRFERETRLVIENQALIYDFLNSAHDFIALAHWNINIDNAWFWRDAGALHVGFLDWGSVAQMNIARAFWGMVCAAELDLLDRHRTDLMRIFVAQYRAAGGPDVSVEEFDFMYRLTACVDAFHWMIDAPTIVETHLPTFAEVDDRKDPRLQEVFLARAQQHILTVMLNEFSYARATDAIAELKKRSHR
ncbi:hypothetical protein ASE06_15610 [Sphingopyxis sp. Root214]|nr:hypothetical protein ASD73_13265 [Sphingopyxis sp. Root154]KRC07904.1 hypothetical protein ASE06_15610 [Sphingopyxis sp. Root214]